MMRWLISFRTTLPQKFRRKWSIPGKSKSSSFGSSGRSRTQSNSRSGARDFLRVGVTGGIGSGKSTACSLFRSLGRTVLEADPIARVMMEDDAEMRASIVRTFGADTYLPSGRLNKERISEIVFGSPKSRKALNALVHPRVLAHIAGTLQSLPAGERTPYTLIEAALVFESGMENELDYTIVVHADEEVRIGRIMRRDNISREAVLKKIAAQMSPAVQMRKADFVLENNNGDLLSAVRFLDQLLSHIDPSPV